MKIFITGLCFQGNKGGPAIALSLRERLNNIYPGVEILFSVPGESQGESFKAEKKWADKYNIKVVENFSHHDFLKYLVFKSTRRSRVVGRWIAVLKASDLILDMTAISYVGPPLGTTKRIILNGRFVYFVLAKYYKRPFLAWTQSYGPFSNRLIRALARYDLNSLPIVFCRGDACEQSVKKLIKGIKTRSFPDVAISLAWNKEEYKEAIPNYFKKGQKIVTLSPSAVIYARHNKLSGDNMHIKVLAEFVSELIRQSYKILLVPHLYNTTSHDPNICDFGVCCELLDRVNSQDDNIRMLEGDFSATLLKSIISQAYVHVGGRYHSLVASLSTGVPSIALSWHPKYQDLMAQYDVVNYVIGDNSDNQSEAIIKVFSDVVGDYSEIRNRLIKRQQELMLLVDENINLLANNYQMLL